MEYILYNKETDRIYAMYLDKITWSGAMYYYGSKWTFDKKRYIALVTQNTQLEFIGQL